MAVFTGLGSSASPSITFSADTNTGIFSPTADHVAISTNGTERIRIAASGQIGLAGANYGTSGQTLTSNGSGAAPTWQTPLGFGDKIEEGNTNAEVIDTGSDGRFVVTTEGTERLRVASAGQIGLSGANYGTNGQVLTSAGTGAAPTWETPGGGGGDKIEEGNTSAEVIDTGSDGRFVVTTEGSERARIDSSGRLLVGTSSANANGGVLQLSSGITFPATAVAATDVNTLDDYEEGTWTPAYGSGSNTWSYTTQIGRYTKTGNQVIYTFSIAAILTANPNVNSQVGVMLPFSTGGFASGLTYGSCLFGFSNQTHIITGLNGAFTWSRSASAEDGNGFCNPTNWPAATTVTHVGHIVSLAV